MQNKLHPSPNWLVLPAVLVISLAASTASRADDTIVIPDYSMLPKDLLLLNDFTTPTNSGMSRIRLFRVQPGFISNPVGLDTDTDSTKSPTDDDGPSWLNVSMGNDNPYFDVRRPGDPGGVGYYRINSQVQLFDSRTTGLAVNLQAVAPAGRDSDGVQDGQKVLVPGISLFHTLDNGTAFQGYIGKNMCLNTTSSSNNPSLQQGLQYGVTVQHPLWLEQAERAEGCYLFIGASGRYRNPDLGVSTNTVDMLPGLHYQMSPNTFVTGTLIVPMSGAPTTTTTNSSSFNPAQQWQLTLSWQF